MIVKIFKLSTMEMWTLKNKRELIELIEQETGIIVPCRWTIKQLIKYLPIESYHIITPTERSKFL